MLDFSGKWIRIAMCYRRFPNLREMFQGDLNTKLIEGVISRDYKNLECNCQKGRDECLWNEKCRTKCAVYKYTGPVTRKFYIGQTQQFVKRREQQHVQEAKNRAITGAKSDSFAEFFGGKVPKEVAEKKNKKDIKIEFEREIIWNGNLISCMKTFGTRGCKLCNKERYLLLKHRFESPKLSINKCHEIYGACRHKSAFHRFEPSRTPDANIRTDESDEDERINHQASSTKSTDTHLTTRSNESRRSTQFVFGTEETFVFGAEENLDEDNDTRDTKSTSNDKHDEPINMHLSLADLERGRLRAALMMGIECEKEVKHNRKKAPDDVTFLSDQENSELDPGENW
jgi:hypothetical protein